LNGRGDGRSKKLKKLVVDTADRLTDKTRVILSQDGGLAFEAGEDETLLTRALAD